MVLLLYLVARGSMFYCGHGHAGLRIRQMFGVPEEWRLLKQMKKNGRWPNMCTGAKKWRVGYDCKRWQQMFFGVGMTNHIYG